MKLILDYSARMSNKFILELLLALSDIAYISWVSLQKLLIKRKKSYVLGSIRYHRNEESISPIFLY